MIAVTVIKPGDETQLKLAEVPDPTSGAARTLLIRVRCTALNRADLMQRQGMYPPPPGASEILGLECAGEVAEVGREVQRMAASATVPWPCCPVAATRKRPSSTTAARCTCPPRSATKRRARCPKYS